jgi:hypothetical protein
MYNTKELLREEINLSNKKMLLSEQSIALIENSEYVKNVLGIKTPLTEYYSIELRKQIIEEAISMQSILQSANNYLGSAVQKGKEYAVQAIETIKSTKDIVLLFKDLILSPENMVKANKSLNNICLKLINDVENVITFLTDKIGASIQGFTTKMVNMLTQVKNVITNQIKGEGWLGFLSKLGIGILLTYIKLNFFDKIIKLGIKFIQDGSALVNGIETLLDMFKNFKETIIQSLDINQIISWIVSIGKEAATLNLSLGFDILVAVTTVCSAVLASLNFKLDLQKRQ